MSDRERALAGPRALKERGSPDWCWQTVDYLQSYMRHVSNEWGRAQEVLNELIAARAWEVIPHEQPYGSLDHMLRGEIGLDKRAIDEAIRKAAIAAHGGDRKSADFQNSNGNLKAAGGNNQTYVIRRLRSRGHLDLADQVEGGELSAREAARKAGFRFARPTMTVRSDDARSAFDTLCGNHRRGDGMDRDQLEHLADLLWHHFHPEQNQEN